MAEFHELAFGGGHFVELLVEGLRVHGAQVGFGLLLVEEVEGFGRWPGAG